MAVASIHFAVVPPFSQLEFADGDPLERALDVVLELRGKHSERDELVRSLSAAVGENITIGALRSLTDHDWRSLPSPAVCWMLLKHVVRQSRRVGPPAATVAVAPAAAIPSEISAANNGVAVAAAAMAGGSKPDDFTLKLMQDFNHGQPLDEAAFGSSLDAVKAMGFTHHQALEALCVTNNQSVESALEFLLSEKSARARKRSEAVARLGKQGKVVLAAGTGTALDPDNTAGTSSQELAQLQAALAREQEARNRAEQELEQHRANSLQEKYLGFVRGIIASDSVTVREMEQLRQYRETSGISDAVHQTVLRELNFTEASFEALKIFNPNTIEAECVVCLDKPKSQIIFNCMHVCLCDDCVPQFSRRGAKCPMCSKKVTKVVKIYF